MQKFALIKFRLYGLVVIILVPIFLICRSSYTENNSNAAKNQFKIALFKEGEFLSIGAPPALTPEWLYNNLSKDYSVAYLDASQIEDKKSLNNIDLLILPYGEAFPYRVFQQIKEYLFEGGGLLNIAGRPFWAPMDRVDGKWQKVDVKDPYVEFLAPLGIKYYESVDEENIGLTVTTSLGFSLVRPTRGNVFPYRIPARDFLKSRKGMVFVKSWRNPYIKTSDKIPNKWCLIGSKGDKNPLNPENPESQKNLADIMEYLSFPLVICELETDFAGYRQGEKVEASFKVINVGRTRDSGIIEIQFLDKQGRLVYAAEKPVDLKPQAQAIFKETWQPERFESSFYKIRAILKNGDSILDKEENGFVVIDEDVMKNGASFSIDKDRFIIDRKESPVCGVNYYESKLGELMWLRPNLLRVREDFRAMRDMGINMVRIHYHHSKWFRDYFTNVVKEPLDPYFEAADNTALPSEISLRILDAIIQIAQEEGLIFCMDIFSLVPEEMGNPIGWLGMKERIIEKDKIDTQKEFIKIIAARYKDVPGITWDLWNEPRLEKDDEALLRAWANEIISFFRENGDNHPVTIGGDSTLGLMDVLDYACVHTYEPAEFDFDEAMAKPVIFQETWNPAGMSPEEETRQREELIKDFNAFLNTGAAGFIPWQWTRQARLWNNASEPEKWDDDLGLFVREDGSLKPAGAAFRELISGINRDK